MAGFKRQLQNGKWELCVSLGYDGTGKQIRKYKTISVPSEKAAERELAKFFVEASGKPAVANNKLTFREFILVWQERYHKTLERTTQERNQDLLRKRILPALGSVKLQKMTAETILRFIDELRKPGMRLDGRTDECLSDRTVQIHYKLIRSILNKAVEWKYISENPCKQIRGDAIPKSKSRRLPILQDDQLAIFLQAVEALPYHPLHIKHKLMVSLCLITGARRGEFMALTWDCIDLNNQRIHITKACELLVGSLSLKKPKTELSVRWLNIDDHTKELLKEHKKLQDAYLAENGYANPAEFVFLARRHKNPGVQVSQAYPTSFYAWLRKFCNEHQLPRITTHSFRHMAATYALGYGVPLTTVQHMLGHTDIKTTAIYLHELESKRKEATEIMANAFQQLRHE